MLNYTPMDELKKKRIRQLNAITERWKDMRDDPAKIEIEVGNPACDYQIGNYLNALDQVTQFYINGHGSGILANEAADALEMYAKHVREEG